MKKYLAITMGLMLSAAALAGAGDFIKTWSYNAITGAITAQTVAGTKFVPASNDGQTYSVKNLKVDTVTNTAGTSTPPGMVPLGGMVAVMPNLDTGNAWQPPAHNVIKDGFMRADGGTVPSGQGSPLQGRVLPNMGLTSGGVNAYPRGSAATSWSTGTYTTGGANTQNSNVAVSQQPTYHIPAHYHGKGNLGISDPGHAHTVAQTYNDGLSNLFWIGGAQHTSNQTPFAITSNELTGISISGSYVGAGIYSGDDSSLPAVQDASVAISNTAVNNEPSYVEVVWVIRVK